MITKLNFTDRTIKSYAIRKLTPKECFRLMGVRDNVIGTMQSSNAQAAERLPDWKGKGNPEDMAISASQQYKQAGNSIVVDVLAHIYEQLFYPTPKPRKQKQLSLFDDLEDTLPALPPTAANKNEEKIFLTTFSGYDSQLMAADVLRERHPDFRWTCKGWSDIDKYACQMHNLVFPQFADCALGDITKIDWHEVKSSLEEEVSARYFLKDDAVSKFLKANDSDNALFLQFDLPPTHEAAMFLKTWLTLRMNTLNGWKMEMDELKNCIENEREVLNSDFASFNECHTFPCEGFEELFKENMGMKK